VEQKRLILMVGLPRSGKTTYALSTGAPVVSPDAIRLALHGQPFVATAEPFIWATAKLMVASLFEAGHSVVVLDACNITAARRNEWLDLRWQLGFVEMLTQASECYRRAGKGSPLIDVIARMECKREAVAADMDESYEAIRPQMGEPQ
jgi:predicted kinase